MAASADTATPSNWIYVRDVPETATEDSLKKAFGTFGAIKSVDFSAGRNYQYVEFNSADAATKASSVAVRVHIAYSTMWQRKLILAFFRATSMASPSWLRFASASPTHVVPVHLVSPASTASLVSPVSALLAQLHPPMVPAPRMPSVAAAPAAFACPVQPLPCLA
jgi:hypothetical protein